MTGSASRGRFTARRAASVPYSTPPTARPPQAPRSDSPVQVFDATGGFDPAYVVLEDIDFCIRAALKGFDLQLVPMAVCNYRFRDNLEAMYRQRYDYAYYRTKLSAAVFDRRAFLMPSRWLPLLTRVARQTLSRQLNRILGRRQTPLQLARSNWMYAGVVGELRGSLAHRIAPAADPRQ